MRPALSVLDPAPLFDGRSASETLGDSRRLARSCEALGYRAYWVQEHHNTPSFASVAPEVLIADLAAQTQRILLGAGGVMLPNYSPLKVAEQFATLAALHPGRIELGLGRATGADPRTSAALLGPGVETFPTMLRMLMDWLLDASGEVAVPADHRAAGIHARPAGERPQLWMLSSSAESAAFAGAMGLSCAYADFLALGGAGAALAAYRDAFQPSPFAAKPHAAIALVVLAADTPAAAEAAAAPAAAWNIARASGRFIAFPRAGAARAILDSAGEAATAAARARATVGEAGAVTAKLSDLASQTGADELFLLTIAEDADVRAASYRLIMESWPTT